MMTRASRFLTMALLATAPAGAQPIGTAFTYQGQLTESGAPAAGLYDLQVCLFDSPSNPVPIACAPDFADVPVESGLFTLALDFGSAPFAGQQRFIELRVRPGASAAGYTILAPRQPLRPAPEALRAGVASAAPWSGLTGVPAGFSDGIDDVGGGGTVTSIVAGAGLSGGTITGSGTIGIATGGVGSAQIADGGIAAVDVAADSLGAGQIAGNAVAASELADNAVDSAAVQNLAITQAKIAAGAVGASQLAAGAVGLSQINTAQVQARIAGTCVVGEYFRGINADGSVACEPVPGVPRTSVVDDPPAAVGFFASTAIGTDGRPVVAYFDASNLVLKVAKCANSACTGTPTITTVDDPANDVGRYASIAIGTDGFPVVSYIDFTARALKVAKCANAACTGVATTTTVDDPPNQIDNATSIAIGNDGLPVIAYQDTTAGALKVAKCANAACTGAATITTVDDPLAFVGLTISLAIGSDGAPVIAYTDNTGGNFRVAKCANAACTGAATITVLNNPDGSVGEVSLARGLDGLPSIAFRVLFSSRVKVTRCSNPACTATGPQVLVDDLPDSNFGASISIETGPDGMPVLAYNDPASQSIKVARCGNAACSGPFQATTIDDPANGVRMGSESALAIGADGLPVVAYLEDAPSAILKVAKCGTRSCL